MSGIGGRWIAWAAFHRLALDAVRRRQRDAFELADTPARKAALQWAMGSENNRPLQHLLARAETLQGIAMSGDEWDTDPMLLGVANGVIDLQTGRLRAGRAMDCLTKASPAVYDTDATCPRFERFIREIFASHPELVPYMQRVLGYALTGLTGDQCFWILFGSGANGKSTLIELFLQRILGIADYGYSMPFPSATWSAALGDYQKAELVGRRFVTASEVSRRGHLNEELIKSLTGDDVVNARHPYGRPFTFVPRAKFFLRVNEKPVIRDESHGMWRRVKLVPFVETFAVDPTLGPALAAEAPGVLAWAVRGCLEWQREGLCEPEVVRAATADYRSDSDPLAEFLDERCVLAEHARVQGREFFSAYRAWCDERRVPADDQLSQKAVGLRMKARFHAIEGRTTVYAGVGLMREEGK